MTFAKLLFDNMYKSKLNDQALAGLLGVPVAQVKEWRVNKGRPQATHYLGLSTALGVAVDDIRQACLETDALRLRDWQKKVQSSVCADETMV